MNKVNPKHYETYTVKVQPWDICERFPFNLGCCLKYLFRVGKKEGENPLDDLMKAKAYLDRHILNGKEFKADIPECMLPAVTNTCTSIIRYICINNVFHAKECLDEFINSLIDETRNNSNEEEEKQKVKRDLEEEVSKIFKEYLKLDDNEYKIFKENLRLSDEDD